MSQLSSGSPVKAGIDQFRLLLARAGLRPSERSYVAQIANQAGFAGRADSCELPSWFQILISVGGGGL